ncbi:hypothetical protein D3C71_1218810 [compost metagenome]
MAIPRSLITRRFLMPTVNTSNAGVSLIRLAVTSASIAPVNDIIEKLFKSTKATRVTACGINGFSAV